MFDTGADDQFIWLRRDYRQTDSSYVSYSHLSEHTTSSFDFGYDGYAAACNFGGELLQMTAPSKKYGIIFARGDLEYSLYLALGRGQRERGGKATFGLKLPSTEDLLPEKAEPVVCLDRLIDRGSFNYRWPVNEYALKSVRENKEVPDEEDSNDTDIGYCSLVSFIKDGTLYQVLRVDKSPKVAEDSRMRLELEPPLRFPTFKSLEPVEQSKANNANSKNDVRVEGIVGNEDEPKGKLSEDKCIASIYGKLEGAERAIWQTQLWEYDPKTGNATKVPLQALEGRKKDHRSKSSISLPIFKAVLDETGFSRSRVFVAAFTLSEEGIQPSTKQVLSWYDIRDFLSIKPECPLATASMWQTIFVDRREDMEQFSELCELDIVGRCLERILGVDLVPVKFQDAQDTEQPPYSSVLVSNLFLKAQVDLKALFWKTRFLIKADQLLSQDIRRKLDNSNLNPPEGRKDVSVSFQSTDEYNGILPPEAGLDWVELRKPESGPLVSQINTLRRIRHAIGSLMAYLVKTFLESAPTGHVLLPESRTTRTSEYHYVMVTIFYITKHYPSVRWSWAARAKFNAANLLGRALRSSLTNANPLPCNAGVHLITRENDVLLDWLHNECIFTCLWDQVVPREWKPSLAEIKSHRKLARTTLTQRLASGGPYRAEDEIVDRLGFLAAELFPEIADAKTIASRVSKRIEAREFSSSIRPCQLQQGQPGYTGGPWEIHALCHHSRLMVAYRRLLVADVSNTRQEELEDIETFKKKFCPFLTTDGSLVPCWERSNSASRQGFLRSEATAVLGSTLLGLLQSDLKYLDSTNNTKEEKDGAEKSGEGRKIHDSTGPSASKANIDYLLFKPPQRYHPEDFLNSLDDTPHLYTTRYMKKIRIPGGVRKVLSTGTVHASDLGELQKSLPSLSDKSFKFETLQQLKNFCERKASKRTADDLEDTLFAPEVVEHLGSVQLSATHWRQLVNVFDAALSKDRLKSEPKAIVDKLEEEELTAMKSLKVIDTKVSDPLPTSTCILANGDDKLLGDSLIDQDVRHRILVAQTCRKLPASLLRLFTFMLHPEILDCLENHTMRVSKFALEKKTSVIAHITIRSWSLEKKSEKRQEKQQKSHQPDPRGQDILEWNTPRFLNDEELIRLPQELDKIYRVDKQTGDLKRDPPNMELKVSSIGMSTNEFGDFSKFTVITDLIPPQELKKLSRTVHDIWNKFVHQPQTGRFLVFSAILACICQEIAAHYHDAVRVFVGEFQLDSISNSYLTDSRWLQSTEAESRLQLSLWSLEALHKLNNTMEFTVRTIELAKGEIEEEIRKGPGKRSEELEEMCIMYQEPLRRSLAELTAAQIKLERKVELNSRYSDRLSTLLALRDSRAAFSQNNTIQKLTYITIGCLPIALAAALFAVPDDQHVIAPRMGRNWFIYLILIFFFAILATARLLDSIISAFRVLDEVVLKLALRRRTGLWIGYCLGWVNSRCNSVLKQLQDRYHQLKAGKEDRSSIQGQDPELGDLVSSSTQDSSNKQ